MTTASGSSKKAKRVKIRRQSKAKAGRGAGKLAKVVTKASKAGRGVQRKARVAVGVADVSKRGASQRSTKRGTSKRTKARVGKSVGGEYIGGKVTAGRGDESTRAGARTALRGRSREADKSRRSELERGTTKPAAVAKKARPTKTSRRTGSEQDAAKAVAPRPEPAKPVVESEGRATKTSRRGAGKRTTLAKGRPTNEPLAEKSEQAARGGAREAGRQLEFGFKSERSELAVLQKQHRHLLLQIAKRRALITVSKQAIEELMKELTERVVPYREELFAITREISDLRDRLLDGGGLPASQLEKVRWAFHQMLTSLPLEEAEESERIRGEESVGHTAPAASGAARDSSSRAAPRGEETGAEGASQVNHGARAANRDDDSRATDAATPQSNEVSERRAASREEAQPEAPSAAKPSGEQSGALRTLFKKLAITYHPDRVQDDVAKAARTKIMKDLTQAFESGDLARLVELERTLAARTSGQPARETPEKLVQNLSQSNKELRRQLGELKVELDRLKEDCPFSLDLRLRDPARLARDELDQLVLDRHLEVERAAKTREFVAMFASGRMKVADFVKGPPHLRRSSEAQLAQLLK